MSKPNDAELLQYARQRIEDLDDEIAMLTADHSAEEHERHQTFKQQQAVNGALRSSVHEWQMKYADLQRSHCGALKVIKGVENG